MPRPEILWTDAQWREHNRRHKLIDQNDQAIDDPQQQTMFEGIRLNLTTSGRRRKQNDATGQGFLFS